MIQRHLFLYKRLAKNEDLFKNDAKYNFFQQPDIQKDDEKIKIEEIFFQDFQEAHMSSGRKS